MQYAGTVEADRVAFIVGGQGHIGKRPGAGWGKNPEMSSKIPKSDSGSVIPAQDEAMFELQLTHGAIEGHLAWNAPGYNEFNPGSQNTLICKCPGGQAWR